MLCWRSRSHIEMIYVGIGACVVLSLLLAWCAWIVWRLPQELHKANMRFMHSCGFLFFRSNVEAHWFVLVVMLRNLCTAFAPAGPIVQVLFLQFVWLPTLCLTLHVDPWRHWTGNVLDVLGSWGVLMVVLAAALHMQSTNLHSVGMVCFVSFLVTMAIFMLGAAYGIARHVRKRFGRPFYAFICHHRADGGAFARWVQLSLPRKCLMDADLTADLGLVLNAVQRSVEVVIHYLTQRTWTQAWCTAESVATVQSNLPITVIHGGQFIRWCRMKFRRWGSCLAFRGNVLLSRALAWDPPSTPLTTSNCSTL